MYAACIRRDTLWPTFCIWRRRPGNTQYILMQNAKIRREWTCYSNSRPILQIVFLFLAMTVQWTAKRRFVSVQQIIHELAIIAIRRCNIHASTHTKRRRPSWFCTALVIAINSRDPNGLHCGICLTGWRAVHSLWIFIKYFHTVTMLPQC